MVVSLVFFFKQKTAYEMRISDWSSDVCSSDLPNTQEPDAQENERQDEQRGEEAEPAEAPLPKDAMGRKIVNDAVAYIRSLAELRGRHADWAERAVRQGASLPARAESGRASCRARAGRLV